MSEDKRPQDITGHALETIRRWLESGSVDANDIADLPWYVEQTGDDALIAINPLVPVSLLIRFFPEIKVVRIIAHTSVYTADLEPEKKLRLYRYLLRRNLMPLAKTVVDYDNGEVAVMADLSTVSISEEEFNKALANVLSLVVDLFRRVGVPREVKEEAVVNLALFIMNWHKKGMSEEALARLLEKAGMKREEALEVIESIISREEAGGEEKREDRSGETLYI
ncbi:MAG: hypothetical protein GSR78_04380 [Desulfurococcales archaeon]|nr:hypothetical protein [Desulfurococcales archaeon]